MKEWYSIDDICKMLQVCRPTIVRLIKEGKLKAVDIGKGKRPTYKIHDTAYIQFIAENSTKLKDKD